MYNVLITGAGKIGSLIACLLMDTNDYIVHLADVHFNGTDAQRLLQAVPKIERVVLDVTDPILLKKYIQQHEITAVISSLPYFLNKEVAEASKSANAHYFDLTEDTSVAKFIQALAKGSKTAFVPQCGLAPGFISIVANSLMQEFDECHHAKLRVGALPQRASNALHYSLTWSTDGVINEYGNPCHAIEGGKAVVLAPLEGLESIEIDGCEYEAFNTSGGLGSLGEHYIGKIQSINYKTIRYPGHCEKMYFLMNELKLNEDRDILKHILERAIPKTYQDMVLIYVSVEGIKHGELSEQSYFKKIYPKCIQGLEWSAIQVGTAAGICAVVDLTLRHEKEFHGFVKQEQFRLIDVLANRFGTHFS